MTQTQTVHDEILKALEIATTKKELYDIVEKNTGAPRPTVRRVTTDVRKQLERHLLILGESMYDCPECNTKTIKRTDTKCPNCKTELEWK